ncbi:nickel ABC transporter, nickel/metallophore periplasmic binding protein [Oculatella sp. LEGE 06141]|uniref:nickel ABC transporter substrate-binding protein n=1 Tax=Oculatella sp. LEGE 06141 TaxID=1828648 RepID=UPI001881D7DB|nr:nickel ABC transporter substrate-binding protein [Oculatella sp. LEGE 06141]MBE9178144.1 nickel ABC transporter, nickel/metallophore periplasmic binding protein [Oculatella sp. LEGE 06141]
MKNLFRALLAVAVAALIVLPSCAQPQSETQTSKEIIFSWSEDIGPLNPHLYNPSQMFAQDLVYESLVNYGRGGEILPGLAEQWEVSSDGKLMTFQLRQGVQFSDGTPFNAAAAKANLEQVLDNRDEHEWLGLIQEMDRVEAEGESTLKIYLKNAYYPALQELTLIRPVRFLSPKAFPDSGTTAEGIKAPIGTGPWVLADYSKDSLAVFKRNENYWGNPPEAEQVTVRIIPDGETRALAFENGEIDLIYGSGLISLDAFKRLQDSGEYEAEVSPPLNTRAIALNSSRGATQDLQVRQAIQHAFNKSAVIQAVFYNTEPQADTYFSNEVPYADIGLQPYAYDVDRANSLLDEAGWQRQGQGTRQKDGQPLTVELSFNATNNADKAVAEALQADLRVVGIDLRLLGEEEQSWLDRQTSGEFHLIFNDTWGPPYEPQAMMSSMRAPAHADYEAQSGLPMKAEIDRKIGEVLVSTDETTRRQLYEEVLTTLHEQAVYLPISYSTNIAVFHKNLSGFEFMPQANQVPLSKLDKA